MNKTIKKPTYTKRRYELDIKFSEDEFYYMTKMIDRSGKEVGEFRITKQEPNDLGIHIEEQYKNRGYSKILIRKMCNNLRHRMPPNTMLYIDSDASWEPDKNGVLKSYCDYLGMEETPEDDPYYGYEKRILFENLCSKVSGGKKRKTNKKSKKYKKSKKKKKSKKRKIS